MMVLAPSTVQEAVDLTYAAFDYADRDMNPVLILADGVIAVSYTHLLCDVRLVTEIKVFFDCVL